MIDLMWLMTVLEAAKLKAEIARNHRDEELQAARAK